MNRFLFSIFLIFTGCSDSSNNQTSHKLTTTNVKHPSAYIPQECYTKTKDDNNITHNSCFVCHKKNIAPNYVLSDEELQKVYSFPKPALKNPFLNNFKDFSEDVAKISDKEIENYINKSNYFDKNKNIILKTDAYSPDCYYNFDKDGLDIRPDGQYSGWRAFAYMPFFGAFWPKNGSTDDVLIRLDYPFRSMSKNGTFNKTVYKINMAIVESLIKREDTYINRVDEKIFGVDLNKNGTLDYADKIVYKWSPNHGENMSYVGYAKELLKSKKIHLAAGLFPKGTEFLHSVRYIKSDKIGTIELAPRMKELRYAKKSIWLTYAELKNKGIAALKEKELNPNRLEVFRGNIKSGLGNNMGWIYRGFIEDKNGNLRPQSYEETLSCMGCHSGISVTTDSIFSFSRKLNSFKSYQNSWFHWSQHSLTNTPEFQDKDGVYELTNYLKLTKNTDFNQTKINLIHKDVTELLYPDHKRAVRLNKEYRVLVKKQIFIDGRAGHTKALTNFHKELQSNQETGID